MNSLLSLSLSLSSLSCMYMFVVCVCVGEAGFVGSVMGGILAGATAAAVCTPMDVVKTRLQVQGGEKRTHIHHSHTHTYIDTYQGGETNTHIYISIKHTGIKPCRQTRAIKI